LPLLWSAQSAELMADLSFLSIQALGNLPHCMISLRHLDGRRVGVSLPLREPPVWVYGDARFEASEGIAQLKITVADSAGNFDILIKEAQWTGAIERALGDPQAEFLIRLALPPAP
jgi:hypothetical protein